MQGEFCGWLESGDSGGQALFFSLIKEQGLG